MLRQVGGEPHSATLAPPGPWRHRTVSANGIRFHLAEAGSGPLVVLLHGFPEFWWAWRHQLPALAAAGYRAVAVDLRGFGGTDKPPRGYDLGTLAADASGLVRALGEASAVLVGHGIGGLGAWTAAALHPMVVRGVVAVSAPHPLQLRLPRGVPHNLRGLGRGLAFQLPWRPERQLRAEGGRLVTRLLRAWSGPDWPDADVAARYVAALRVPHAAHCGMEYFRWLGRSAIRSDGMRLAARLRATPVGVPTLVLHGETDPLVTARTAAESANHVGGPHRLEPFADAGHFPHEETQEAFNRTLLAWLADPERLSEPHPAITP